MKKQILLAAVAALCGLQNSQAGVYVFSKPGPTTGKDAFIGTMDGGCKNTDRSVPFHLSNFGTDSLLHITDWTWNSSGCPGGTFRTLIQFDAINSIPPGSTITYARIKLYHPHSSAIGGGAGNSNYPGSPYPNTNPGIVYMVDRSAAGVWSANTVTWQNAPSPETSLSASIPVTSTHWDGAQTIDVRALVQAMVTSNINHGFYIKLNTEVHYRDQTFASCEYKDANLWPELELEYVAPAPPPSSSYCNADFTIQLNASNPYTVDCTPTDYTAQWFSWTVDGSGTGVVPAGGFWSPLFLSYPYEGPGCHRICHYASGPQPRPTCGVCYDICINSSGQLTYSPARLAAPESTDTYQGAQLSAVPNPATNQTNIHATTAIKSMRLMASSGAKLREVKDLHTTDYELDISTLAPGLYFVEALTEDGKSINCKFIKQ